MACSKVEADPFQGYDREVRASIEELLSKETGFSRDGMVEHVATTMDFELIGALAGALSDPDAQVARLCRSCVPLGWRCRLPRTPAVFARKTHWAGHVGHESDAQEWTGNYSSAVDHPEVMVTTFAEQVDMRFMIRMSYEEARAKYGERLRVAAMGVLEQSSGEYRMIHDGTHGAQVNAAIRVRDQEGCPAAHDLDAALDHEIAEGTQQLFALALDISKAHRRVPVAPCDWGLQACSDLPRRRAPGPQDAVWVNTVGTYGLGSASYWWARVGALLLRITHYVVTCLRRRAARLREALPGPVVRMGRVRGPGLGHGGHAARAVSAGLDSAAVRARPARALRAASRPPR